MSKKGSTELWDLITSLTKAEKRYFKIHASRHVIGDENKYVKLFDAICRQSEYDEKQLLLNEKYIRQLPLLKKRLHQAILHALDAYHTSIDAELRKLLHHAEILYEKTLCGQAKKILKNAWKIASDYEIPSFLLEILRWQNRIGWSESNLSLVKTTLEQTKKVEHFLKINTRYEDINRKMFSIYNKYGIARNKKILYEAEKNFRSPLLKNQESAQSFEAKLVFLQCHVTYYTMANKNTEAHACCKKMVELFSDNPARIHYHSDFYLNALHNAATVSILMKKTEDIHFYIMKLREAEEVLKSQKDKLKYFFFSYQELNYYIITGQFQKGAKRIGELEKKLSAFENRLNPIQKFILYLHFSITFFGSGNYRKSNFYLNRLLSNPLHGLRSDIESFVHIFQLIVHYEKGSDPSFIRSLVKSTYRFLYNRKQLYKFENCILNFIRQKLAKAISGKELTEGFSNLKEEVIVIFKDPYEQSILHGFDFISWLESKIENRPFAEIIRQKANSSSFG